jgi:predicted DCC family thiol-disulfide oxidoreductase YuxK
MDSECSKATDINDEQVRGGWILYDAECAMCTDLVTRVGAAFRARGFDHAPLQKAWVQQRLGLTPEQSLAEMRVLTLDGRTLGGADAVVYLAGEICQSRLPWCAWLFRLLSKMPLVMRLLRYGYRWVAARRSCRQGSCAVAKSVEMSKEGLR